MLHRIFGKQIEQLNMNYNRVTCKSPISGQVSGLYEKPLLWSSMVFMEQYELDIVKASNYLIMNIKTSLLHTDFLNL